MSIGARDVESSAIVAGGRERARRESHESGSRFGITETSYADPVADG